jgi:L-iditol 2-dehydrogenase
MKAAYLYGKEDIRLEELPYPGEDNQGLLVRVKACGICGSDSRVFFNGLSPRYINPVILGHEICGEVTQVGSGIQGYAVGDMVGIAPIIPCMNCHPCSHGQDNICKTAKVIGCNVHGAMAEYLFVPDQMVKVGGVVRIPPGIIHREAALAELVGCCLHGLRQIGLEPGDNLLVIGGGPIGMTFIQLAKLMGARVFSSEPRPRRRQMAEDLGAYETIDPTSQDIISRFSSKMDRVIVATANVLVTQQAFEIVRAGGSLLLFSGYLSGSTMELKLNDIHYKEIHIHGSIDCTIRDYQNAVALLPQLNMGKLITSSYPLDRIAEGFYATINPDEVKVIIEPESR